LFEYSRLDLLTAYQFENANLNFNEETTLEDGLESGDMIRDKHGIVGILKVHTPTGAVYLEKADVSFSYRYDYVKNQQKDFEFYKTSQETQNNFESQNIWKEQTLKVSAHLVGSGKDIWYSFYLNAGKNVKFPTMQQQLSIPKKNNSARPYVIGNLNPEENNSLEFGFEIINEISLLNNIDGWHFSINYFKNTYENKFRTYYELGSGYPFYENIPNAEISGFEANLRSFLFDNKYVIEIGTSYLNIPEKVAFPFKSNVKHTVNLSYENMGYSAMVNWFYEGEQLAWISVSDGNLGGIKLPSFINMDLHLSKSFKIAQLKYLLTFSARNILKDDTVLQGIAIRDRRYYVGVGLEY